MRWLPTLALIPLLACTSQPMPQSACRVDEKDFEPAREESDRFLNSLDEGRYGAAWDDLAGEAKEVVMCRSSCL